MIILTAFNLLNLPVITYKRIRSCACCYSVRVTSKARFLERHGSNVDDVMQGATPLVQRAQALTAGNVLHAFRGGGCTGASLATTAMTVTATQTAMCPTPTAVLKTLCVTTVIPHVQPAALVDPAVV